MRRIVQWAITNSPAMNMMMIAVLLVGTLSLAIMRREVFPDFDLEIVLVQVPYPGASPEEVEEGICQKIEEATQSIEGIKKTTSVAREGLGFVVLELRSNVRDVQRVVNEVRSEVDRISTFPDLSEDVEVQQVTMRQPAINVGVLAPNGTDPVDELQLRAVAEQVRHELLQKKTVSQVNIKGARDYQIDVEISEETLRKHGLTLQQVAQILRRENLELPGGTIRNAGQEVLLRGKNKGTTGPEIAALPLVTQPGGVVLTVGDLATVHDDFADMAAISEVNGRTALALSINRTASEDLLAMTAEVRDYVASTELPGGYTLVTWGDRSVDVQDRLDMLVNNGTMGLILVFLVLAVFLELRLAFWVALGIPVAMLGAGGILLLGGQTLNMLTMFAFLMALGIVVDDAIVVGENIYAHRAMGKSYIEAAVDGTVEVVPSVVASVGTTIIAFGPMLFMSGILGKFIAVLPIAVIAMLAISLVESTFILPCHLAHRDSLVFRIIGVVFYPFRFVTSFFAIANRWVSRGVHRFIEGVYVPALHWSLRNLWTVSAGAVALLLLTVGFVQAGAVPFILFPKIDTNYIEAKVTFPDGTPKGITDTATRQIESALMRVHEASKADGAPLVRLTHRGVGSQTDVSNPVQSGSASGSHVGSIVVELTDTANRSITSQEVIARWREATGEIAGVENLTFAELAFGPAGTPIEFKLLAPANQLEQLEKAVQKCKEKLATYPGVFDIDDDSRPGKSELQIRVKPHAQSMGVTMADLAETIRASYYGAEVMRLQRGRHEVKLMVRYPADERRWLTDFEDIQIRLGDGQERPLTELAEVQVARGYSEINRVNQMRAITISADVKESGGNASDIVDTLRDEFMPALFAEFPDVHVRWEGQKEQQLESLGSLKIGTVVALLVMFFLLTLEFRSYLQPVLVLLIIPFGFIGAILGHAVMGLPLTLFSFFGLVALTGVVINDSIVLIDFINHRVKDGIPIDTALIDAGRRRFRPVLLTSITTIAGLLPILLETSFQAQILIPMATSLSFGLLVATLLVLVLVPVFYRIYFHLLPDQVPEVDEHDPVAPIDVSEHPTPELPEVETLPLRA